MLNKLNELKANREEGFTLIELLVVIVIIGVLAAIALPIFLNQQKAAIAAGVKSDVRNTVGAVATMLVKTPTASDVSTVEATNSNEGSTTIAVTGGWDDYTVAGSNDGIDGTYTFDSTTGKYVGAGANF